MRGPPAPAPRRSFGEKRAAADAARARRSAVEDPEIVMEAAAAFLAVRPRSISETGRRLRHLGYPPPLVERVVERLIEMGYLDDEAFARAWVASRDRARPRGETVLRRELRLKGIERDVVVTVLGERATAAETPEDATGAGPQADAVGADRAAAERLLARRRSALMREPDLRKRRQRAYALLARSGFDPEVCRELSATVDVTAAASAADEEPEPD